jgi:hypothetical protein
MFRRKQVSFLSPPPFAIWSCSTLSATSHSVLSLPGAAHLHLKVGVLLASDVSSPTRLHFESRCPRLYAFCQRCPLCWLISGHRTLKCPAQNLSLSQLIGIYPRVTVIVPYRAWSLKHLIFLSGVSIIF